MDDATVVDMTLEVAGLLSSISSTLQQITLANVRSKRTHHDFQSALKEVTSGCYLAEAKLSVCKALLQPSASSAKLGAAVGKRLRNVHDAGEVLQQELEAQHALLQQPNTTWCCTVSRRVPTAQSAAAVRAVVEPFLQAIRELDEICDLPYKELSSAGKGVSAATTAAQRAPAAEEKPQAIPLGVLAIEDRFWEPPVAHDVLETLKSKPRARMLLFGSDGWGKTAMSKWVHDQLKQDAVSAIARARPTTGEATDASEDAGQQWFPDGVVWMSFGRGPMSSSAPRQGFRQRRLRSLLYLLGSEAAMRPDASLADLCKALRVECSLSAWLIILDDVWPADADFFLDGGPHNTDLMTGDHASSCLITSCVDWSAGRADVDARRLRTADLAPATERLLTGILYNNINQQTLFKQDQEWGMRLLRYCNHHALSIRLVGSLVRYKATFRNSIAEAGKSVLDSFQMLADHVHSTQSESSKRCMMAYQLVFKELEPEAKQLAALTQFFPAGEAVPTAALHAVSVALGGDEQRFQVLLQRLQMLSVLETVHHSGSAGQADLRFSPLLLAFLHQQSQSDPDLRAPSLPKLKQALAAPAASEQSESPKHRSPSVTPGVSPGASRASGANATDVAAGASQARVQDTVDFRMAAPSGRMDTSVAFSSRLMGSARIRGSMLAADMQFSRRLGRGSHRLGDHTRGASHVFVPPGGQLRTGSHALGCSAALDPASKEPSKYLPPARADDSEALAQAKEPGEQPLPDPGIQVADVRKLEAPAPELLCACVVQLHGHFDCSQWARLQPDRLKQALAGMANVTTTTHCDWWHHCVVFGCDPTDVTRAASRYAPADALQSQQLTTGSSRRRSVVRSARVQPTDQPPAGIIEASADAQHGLHVAAQQLLVSAAAQCVWPQLQNAAAVLLAHASCAAAALAFIAGCRASLPSWAWQPAYTRAIQSLVATTSYTAQDVAILEAAGATLLQLGQPEEALMVQERVLEARTSPTSTKPSLTLMTRTSNPPVWSTASAALIGTPSNVSTASNEQAALAERCSETVKAMHDVGRSLLCLGRDEEALAMYRRAIQTFRPVLGSGHPEVLKCVRAEAAVLLQLGRLAEALDVLKATLDAVGERHSVAGAVLSDLGGTLAGLGRLQEALDVQDRAQQACETVRGECHPETLLSMLQLGCTLHHLGRVDDALAQQERATSGFRQLLGEQDPYTLLAMQSMAATQVQLGHFKEALAIQRKVVNLLQDDLGATHPDTLEATAAMAATLVEMWQPEKAQKLLQNVLDVSCEDGMDPGQGLSKGPSHPAQYACMHVLALALVQLGTPQAALVWHQRAVDGLKETIGGSHLQTLHCMHVYGLTLQQCGLTADALELQQPAFTLLASALGSSHLETIAAAGNLSRTFFALGKFKKAAELLRYVVDASTAILGAQHPQTTRSMGLLGSALCRLSKVPEATELLQRAMDGLEESVGARHPWWLAAAGDLGETLIQAGQVERASKLLVKVREGYQAVLGESASLTLRATACLATCYVRIGRLSDALRLQAYVADVTEVALGATHPETLAAVQARCATLVRQGRLQDALDLQEASLDALQRRTSDQHPETFVAMGNMSVTMVQLGQLDEARDIQEQALAGLQATHGEDHVQTAQAAHMLAITLQQQSCWDEALALQRGALRTLERACGRADPLTMEAALAAAASLQQLGKLDEVLELQGWVVSGFQDAHGDAHPSVLVAKGAQAMTMVRVGQLEDALQVQEQVATALHSTLGDQHPHTLSALRAQCTTLQQLDRHEEAVHVQSTILNALSRALGDEHPETLKALRTCTAMLQEVGWWEEAAVIHRRCVEALRSTHGESHTDTQAALASLGEVCIKLGEMEEALEVQQSVLNAYNDGLEESHPNKLSIPSIARPGLETDGIEGLEPHLRALAGLTDALGKQHPLTKLCRDNVRAMVIRTAGLSLD